jgi:hypothetical protein
MLHPNASMALTMKSNAVLFERSPYLMKELSWGMLPLSRLQCMHLPNIGVLKPLYLDSGRGVGVRADILDRAQRSSASLLR